MNKIEQIFDIHAPLPNRFPILVFVLRMLMLFTTPDVAIHLAGDDGILDTNKKERKQ